MADKRAAPAGDTAQHLLIQQVVFNRAFKIMSRFPWHFRASDIQRRYFPAAKAAYVFSAMLSYFT